MKRFVILVLIVGIAVPALLIALAFLL